MKIEKAIEILILADHTLPSGGSQDFKDAINLGIEALKHTKAGRDLKTGWEIIPLPGEDAINVH